MAPTANSGQGSRDKYRLDDLMRELVMHHDDSAPYPEPDVILSYLHGTATDQEKEIVAQALATSLSFREMLVELAQSFHQMDAEHDGAIPHDVSLTKMPRVHKFIQSEFGTKAKSPISTIVDAVRRFRENFISPPWRRMLIPAIATPLLVLAVIITMNVWKQPTVAVLTKADQLEPAYFVPMIPMGPSPDGIKTLFPSSSEAAYNGFKEVVEYIPRTQSIKEHEYEGILAAGQSSHTIIIQLKDGTQSEELKINYRHEVDENAINDYELWSLGIPSLSVLHWEGQGVPDKMTWEGEADTCYYILLTYPVSGGFKTSLPSRVGLSP